MSIRSGRCIALLRSWRLCVRVAHERQFVRRVAPRASALAALLFSVQVFAADPQIAAWTDSPDPVPAGGLVTYSARIDNSSLDAATAVAISVPVPAGSTFVSATAPCALAAGVVTCPLGTVGGSGTDVRNLDFVFRANGPGPSAITAVATLTASNDTNTANNTQSQTTTVISGGDLALTKSGSPNPVVGGANVTYTLIASNAGPNVSGDIVIQDNLPPAVSLVSSSGSGWTCSSAGNVVTCTHPGPHAVAAPIPALTLVGKVNAAGGTITNSASVAPAAAGGTVDPDTSNNTATVDTAVTPGADVRIAQKTVTSPTPATANANVTFSIQPRNGGPAVAVNAVVTDVLPPGWTYVSASGPNWTCTNAGQTVRCTRPSFPIGAADDITVVARAPNNAAVGPTGTSYTNTASIASDTPDPDHGNDSGSVGINVLPDGADLRISKSKTPNPVALGSQLTSTIRVTNNGPRVATGPLRVVELLTGETYVSASGSGWTCVANGSTVGCTNPNTAGLAVGASLPDLVILSTATVAGSSTNNACTGASLPAGATGFAASPPVEGDPNNTNDCQSVSSNSTSTRPDLAIAKTTSTPTGGDKIVSTTETAVTYTLVVSNVTSPGTDAATGVVIRDTVPAYLASRTTINPVTAVVSGGTATFGCTISGASVVCTQTGGQLSPGQTVTVPITVNRPMQDGSFTNTATVGNTVEGDPNAGNNSASDTVQIDPIADIEVTGKTVTPTAVRAGEPATYVVSYRNNGPSSAANVNLVDAFTFAAGDPGATVLSIVSSKPGSTCTIAAGATLAPASSSYSCALGTLANGETQSITLVVRPNFQTGNGARVFNNTASITTTTVENPAGGNNGNNSKSATLPINPALVDLLTNKTDLEDPVPFAGNAFLNYRVTVGNNGPSYATGVRISETITPPAGRRIRFVCDTAGPSSAVCNAPSLCTATNITSAPGVALSTFSCDVPTGTTTTGPGRRELAANQQKIIYLRFEAIDAPTAAGDTFNNVATASANEPDSFAGNDTATEQTTVRQQIDLAVVKTASLASVSLHQPFTWTVTVTNNGPGNSQQTDLTDTLPAGAVATGAITFTRSSPAGSGSCVNTSGALSCSLGVLNSGGVATITIPVRIDAFPSGGTLTNSATVDTDPNKIGGIDPVPGNNTGTSTVTVTRSSIAGTVFQDADRSPGNGGTPQAPAVEPRIAGVVLTLTGTDANGNAVNVTTTTDASGNYVFDNLAPSNAAGYLVTETQPAGFVNSPSNPPTTGPGAPSAGGTYASGGAAGNSSFAAIVLATGTAATGYNFPEIRQPTLSGFVYLDANLNNVRDPASDPPIANATIRLLNAATGTVVATTTTDATGAYRFAGLDPSIVYTIEEPLPSTPAGLASGPVNPGLVNGAACASGCVAQPGTPTPGTDRIATIDLGSGADGTQFNFGELQQSAISGTVYIDRNRNGVPDASPTDGRIAGVTVRLVQGATCATGTTLQTTVTAADGSYAFGAVVAGQSYLICETQPAGYAQGANNAGTGATVPNVDDTISIASLPATGSSGNHFGERVGTISGYVFLDANDDGLRAGDTGIAGVVLTLSGVDVAGNPVNRTTITDASGAYRFDDLLTRGPGGYTITEQTAQPVVGGRTTLNGKSVPGNTGGTGSDGNASPSTIGAIPFSAAVDSAENNFGEILPGSIAGTVFVDLNNDGVQQPGDAPIGGVTITLQGTDDTGTTVTRTTTTAADGSYSFPNLRPGLYSVTEPNQPPGTTNGRTVAGSAGGNPTPPTTTPSSVVGIALVPGTVATGYNFAEIANSGSIAGRVYLDANDDGVSDAAEAGLANVTVQLTGTDSAGNAVSRTAVTDASGNYTFGNLAAGSYRVTEPTQPTGTLNGITTVGSGGGVATPVGTTPSAIGTIALAAGQSAVANNFGELAPASIAGRVYGDNNNDGLVGNGETGIANVSVVLTGIDDQGNAVNATVATDANGAYLFANLRPGSYTVTEPTQPPGTVNGITTAGTIGGVPTGIATTPAVTPSSIRAIVVVSGAQSIANNFGEIGNSPDLLVTKATVESRFTVNNIGTYAIRVRNGGQAPTVGTYRVADRLPLGLTLDATPTGAGWTCSGAAGATTFACTASDVLVASATNPNAITAKVRIGIAALAASPVDNAVLVDGGGELDARGPTQAERDAFAGNAAALPVCAPGVTQNACRTSTLVQASASISGTAWYDIGSAGHLLDGGDRRLAGWSVEVLDAAGNVVARAVTGADGTYRINDLVPGAPLTVRFRDPQSHIVWGYPVNGESAPGSSGAGCDQANAIANGTASSCPGTGSSPQLTVVLVAGQNLPQQSLPVDPSGVVYDSGSRQPVPGSTVTLAPVGVCTGWDPSTGLVAAALGGYTINGTSVSMTVGIDGFYQFLFAPAAPASCTFGLTVAPPAGFQFVSTAIPPSGGPLNPPGGPGTTYPVAPQAGPPAGPIGPATSYFLSFTGGSAGPNIIHNHLPVDPATASGLTISKTGDRQVVEVGDTIRYTITVVRNGGAIPRQITIVDRLPRGFTFVAGTAVVNGVPIADPAGKPGPRLAFNLGTLPAGGQLVLQYRVRVGVGSQQGDGVNHAIGFACGAPTGCVTADGGTPLAGATATNEARYRVRVTGGVFTNEACLLGKIFVDCNGNHVQDPEELGIPGVRLVMSDGTSLISDVEGKYSLCGLAPRSQVLKVDPHTLPDDARLTTSSNRNLGDAGSLWLDLKNGELHRADFVEGSCSNKVLEQVKARRSQGEIRSVETEKPRGPALRFESKAHGLTPTTSPKEGTDSANQTVPKPRDVTSDGSVR